MTQLKLMDLKFMIMNERKINLEEIAISIFPKDLESGFQYNSFNNTLQIFIKKAMKEACRQTLELVAEEAQLVGDPVHNVRLQKDYTIGIMQINDYSDDYYYRVDTESILNTINQIE